MHVEPGTRFGRYEVVSALGVGGMGRVFRARDERLGRDVAIKVLVEKLAADPLAHQRFEREVRAVAALSHPNILAIYDFGEQDGVWYAVMELLEGHTLRTSLRRGALDAPTAVAYGAQIARGLSAAHAKNIVHRDLKPENLMLQSDGTLKILDFGIAGIAASGQDEMETGINSNLTGVGTIIGTTDYMSPEQVRADDTDARTDIFALGVVLYEMLSGVRPFTGNSVAERASAILRDTPGELSIGVQPHSGPLRTIVMTCLEKDPARRYRTALDVAEALEAIDFGASAATITTSTSSMHAPPARGESIAVLPFSDMSADRSLDYFCDGIAEEIISALSRVSELRVVARSSAFQFKGRSEDVRKIGASLNVGTVLEGSVRSSGQRLRVVTQLINSADGYQIWSEKFDRNLDDIFEVQDEIARAVVSALRIKVGGSTVAKMAAGTRDLDAYTLYLKGRHHWNKRSAADLRRALDYYQQAIARDPSYGRAHAGLAEAYVTQGLYGLAAPHDVMPLARASADTAAQFADARAAADAVRGCVSAIYDWDWPAAGRHFDSALVGHSDGSAQRWHAINYRVPLRRFDEALEELRQAQEADPLSLTLRMSVGLTLYFANRFNEALPAFAAILELDPAFAAVRPFLALTLAELGRHDEAHGAIGREFDHTHSDEWVAALGYVAARRGDTAQAGQALDALVARADVRYVAPSLPAQIHVALGRRDEALLGLERAVEVHAADLAWVHLRPAFAPLRDEPRFQRVVTTILGAGAGHA